jgi:Spy/CpxP family protein refolding chaperone
MQLLLGLSLLLNCFVLAGFVYRSWIVPPTFEGRPPPPPPGSRPGMVEILVHDLDLDAAQRQALGGQLDRYNTARRERSAEIQKVREQITAELKRPKLDMTRIDGLVDQITRSRADQWKESLHAMADLEPALRPDQRERLHAMLAERFAGTPWQQQRAPGGPPGPAGRGPGPGRPPQ